MQIVRTNGATVGIIQDLGCGHAQYQPTIGVLQQQPACRAGETTAVECRFNTAAHTSWRVKRPWIRSITGKSLFEFN
jgi:hypothetical protein